MVRMSWLNTGNKVPLIHQCDLFLRTQITPLNTLRSYRPGQSGKVLSIVKNDLTAKLAEMGIYEGQLLKVLFRAPLGDPIAVDVGGYILSLRLDEAQLVRMEPAKA